MATTMVLNGRKLFVIMLTITGGMFELKCVKIVKMSEVKSIRVVEE